MAQIRAGSTAALGELYNRYCDRAYRIAFVVCRDAGVAQDAVQNAFLSVWSSDASCLERRGTVAAWLLTCVRHRATDLARQVATPAEAQHLEALLDLLPDDQREVITLAFYGGLSHTEIAAQLDLPPGAVKGRMRLGLHKIRSTLERATA